MARLNARAWLPWAALVALAGAGAWAVSELGRRPTRPSRPGTPLVVFFHGKGGRDATYEAILDPLGLDYVLPHGYRTVGDRHEWWSLSSQTEDQTQYAEDVEQAADTVIQQLQPLIDSGRPLLLAGHSQGAQLAATLAMRGVAPAVVASGWIPDELQTLPRASIVFVHGVEDPYAPFERTKAMVDELSAAGGEVRLVAVPGAGHTFTGPLLDTWRTELTREASPRRSSPR